MPWNDKDALTPQALNSRSGLLLNVKDPDFGATGDGVTDDTTAIKAAIAAGGGTSGQTPVIGQSAVIFLPDGDYVVSSQLVLDSHQTLRGEGMGTTITYNGSDFCIRTANNANYVDLENFTILGRRNTSADGGILIGNLSTEAGFTAYCSLRDIVIKGFDKTNAAGLHLQNPSHMQLSNVSSQDIPNGRACTLSANMTGAGVINFSGCKFGEFSATNEALFIEASGGGRMDDVSFNGCFFGGTSTTGLIKFDAPANSATDRFRNHHNFVFNACHAEAGSASALDTIMDVKSIIGLIINGFQMQATNHSTGADATNAIKFTNTGWIKDIHIRGWYAPNVLTTGTVIGTDWSGSGRFENINIETPAGRADTDAELIDLDDMSSSNDVIEILDMPRSKPNWIKNSDFSSWSLGASSAPDQWSSATDGSGSVVLSSGAGNFKIESSSAQIKMASGTFFTLIQNMDEFQFFKNKTVTLNAWLKTDLTNAKIAITDGVGETNQTLNSDNEWHWVKLTRIIDASATRVEAKFFVDQTSSDGLRVDGVVMTPGKQGVQHWYPNEFFDRRVLQRAFTWNPGELADGVGETLSVSVTGAVFGDIVTVGAPYDLQDITISGYVQAADTVEIRLQNESTNTINLANSTAWVVRVWRQ